MTLKPDSKPDWGNRYRLVASEKWKANSATMDQPATDALVEYAQPALGMRVIDLASGTGEPCDQSGVVRGIERKIHAGVHAAVRRYSDGERVAFGASGVMASGKK